VWGEQRVEVVEHDPGLDHARFAAAGRPRAAGCRTQLAPATSRAAVAALGRKCGELDARGAGGVLCGGVDPQPRVDRPVGNHSDEDKHHDQDRGDQGQLGRRGDQPFAFNSMAETLLYCVDDEADDA
jgi:hypothetical protein